MKPALKTFESEVQAVIKREVAKLGKELCGHPELVKLALEAPVALVVAGFCAEAPELCNHARLLGIALVLAAVEDFNHACR